MRLRVFFFFLALAATAKGQSRQDTSPEVRFHLTARPWAPVNQPKAELLDRVDRIIHALATLQYYNAKDAKDIGNGSIIDPYNAAEWQYSTAYFAFATATALSQGRAADLIDQGARAMDRATLEVATGSVPQNHGEFVVAPTMKALRLFQSMQTRGMFPDSITPDRLAKWKSRMSAPREKFMNMGVLQNWRTYASKGEWLRQQDGLISDGVAWIESNWLTPSGGSQRARFRRDADQYGISPYFLTYHDDTGDPETFAYNGAAAGNILDMLESGYPGASAADMRRTVEYNLHSDLLYMGASGEAPAGGRTGDHVWNDIVYGNDFDAMAEISFRNGDLRAAGQYRRAAELAFRSAWRFQQEKGWFSVTKNLFDPSLKNHYATYSALTNYNGYVAIHTCEAYFARKTNIPEQPAPGEIGGYCVKLDPSYANTFLDAGGMQMQICTRGTVHDLGSGVLWHTLGITRFSRAGWDSRLGPADGFVNPDFSAGASFCPAFVEDGHWKNVCTLPDRYEGRFIPEFIHPLLIRGTLVIAPEIGKPGPGFAMKITVTPDGALIDTMETSGTNLFGVVWPLIEYDGRTRLVTHAANQVASTAYPRMSGTMTMASPAEMDQENFIALNGGDRMDTTLPAVRGGYGDLLPIRVSGSNHGPVQTFVYPRGAGDPSAESVLRSFTREGSDFSSVLGWVKGNLYMGRTSAGGQGSAMDLGTGKVTFSRICNFILQLRQGKVTAVEADSAVAASVEGREVNLQPFTPVTLPGVTGTGQP